jgi:hypothetical protein
MNIQIKATHVHADSDGALVEVECTLNGESLSGTVERSGESSTFLPDLAFEAALRAATASHSTIYDHVVSAIADVAQKAVGEYVDEEDEPA